MAAGYIANQKKVSGCIGAGFMLWALAGIPYVMFMDDLTWRYLGMAVLVIAGISSFVLGSFAEQEQYKILKEEPLIFDHGYLKELSGFWQSERKKYVCHF